MTDPNSDPDNELIDVEKPFRFPGEPPSFLAAALGELLPAGKGALRSESSVAAPSKHHLVRRLVTMLATVGVIIAVVLMSVQSFAISRTLSQVLPIKGEQDQGLISPIRSNESTLREQTGTIRVQFMNVTFPTVVEWIVDGQSVSYYVPSGTSSKDLQISDDVVVFCKPCHDRGWFQVVQLFLKRDKDSITPLGNTLNKVPLTLQANDELIIYFAPPSPPWNAVCLPFRNEWILVTLERPDGTLDAETWLSGGWNHTEEYPNSAFFWAMYDEESIARTLAGFFVQNRSQEGKWGRFRGPQHVSIIVPGGLNEVSPLMQKITADELEPVLLNAFQMLKAKVSPRTGRSFEEEINIARKFLEENR